MFTVARPTHCMPCAHCCKAYSQYALCSLLQDIMLLYYAHCYKALSVPYAHCSVTFYAQGLQGYGFSKTMLTAARPHHAVPYAPFMLQGSLLQGIISALFFPVLRARHHQCPMPPCCKASCPGLCMVWSGLCYIP